MRSRRLSKYTGSPVAAAAGCVAAGAALTVAAAAAGLEPAATVGAAVGFAAASVGLAGASVGFAGAAVGEAAPPQAASRAAALNPVRKRRRPTILCPPRKQNCRARSFTSMRPNKLLG